MGKRPRTYPIAERHNLVKLADFARLPDEKFSIGAFIDSLPNIHAGKIFRRIVDALANSRKAGRPIILGMGAHVIKCGLAPFINKMIRSGCLTGIAMNGAGAIHDFELAAFGETSEDVAKELPLGRFGFAEETGDWMGRAIRNGSEKCLGFGDSLFQFMKENRRLFPNIDQSLLWTSGEHGIHCTVHVAIGTDFIHMHPSMDGKSLGGTTFRDFEIFCEEVEDLENGVYWNLGSAVVLPEVFLKAVSRAHNLGKTLNGMTTVDMDMLVQYRSMTNVVKRPSTGIGRGYHLTGHHEIMFPLISQAYMEAVSK